MLCFAVSDIAMVNKMADEYILEIPNIAIPDCSPEWVSAMFPPLIKSIYESYNGTIRETMKDLNASFIEVEQKIENLSKLTKTRSQLSDNDYVITKQHCNITKLQSSVDRNEAYNRRSNLIFGGIAKDANGSCTSIVKSIMCETMNIQQAEFLHK